MAKPGIPYFKTGRHFNLIGRNITLNGYQYICDSMLNVLKTALNPLNTGGINTSVQDKLDEHELALLDDDHYILLLSEAAHQYSYSLHPASGVTVVDKYYPGNRQQRSGMANGKHLSMLSYGNSVEGNIFSDASSVQDYLHEQHVY